eukprot:SAG31_NODE_376_length_16541_cov_4.520922_1_plen_105_part_00
MEIRELNRGMPYHTMHGSNLDLPPTPGMPTMISARRDGARLAPRGHAPRASAQVMCQLRLGPAGPIAIDPLVVATPLAVRRADQVVMILSTGSKCSNRTLVDIL